MNRGVICLGEALIDFIPMDSTNEIYQKSPGGAPANVAVGLAKLGAKSTFVGKVGDDLLGRFLKETLTKANVNTEHMLFSKEVRTGATFVTLAANGERSFDFYINPSADRFLEKGEIAPTLFEEHGVLHFGSISLISEPARTATRHAVSLAKKNGLMISYDPNLRLNLWEDEEQARLLITSMLGEADVLKISEEELAFITGEQTIEAGLDQLVAYNIPLVFVTLGEKGSIVSYNGIQRKIPAMAVQTVDTTGAGDAFVSAILFKLQEERKQVAELSIKEVEQMARFASVSGGLAAATKGAMTALPTLEKVNDILRNEQME
ncbi:aminoimidazole riboside kinase [Halalkalibacterium halodurans]|uniref:Fructokinase n=1 Tax=Halalkalibacterium halodurans (strain ATCC BAA-125 / DSM 18197 / FERM 7344 / JCM 9153 / C-125) TaxID=272558 RepID=Q9KBR8_HALH5|nr:aminoimidazole riboside kinase [Halalkalibacterium halodurans]MED4082276.1 aminoimidazole riboside kinase [Halalkalibacterium halodurans]MED4083573.1 aminoimidazole riboside kinase [Halalkalibacterium halodurans]MED4105886.1 aminoimidazole riboside kinase [Halalkalibacterium halodurans]MED4109998.1 aminoimidazole riboside kinase [Halalkalibacterium halodurans]MED4125019.1 aminoimidazole riboside kinase [Halalkalibacterium halodurans]